MKTLVKFYEARQLSWVDKRTGESRTGWLQPFDMEQGQGIRPLQAEAMRMNRSEVVSPGDYEADFYLEKQNSGRLDVRFLNVRPIRAEGSKPAQVA
ncbi:hypothetical protein HF288_02195 [Acidithiobacillus caldus]|jgi:outer membrane usher protein FimD/PapC|uniref:hypothetical protein n=1 Tax=Acidithiobacillus caldus TaxID=33059 RepID=UPI001C075B58|nr:hypothetical protein [Acidithiobacillus caldus]MBU2790758.1 hypothetical protein [Acidithiobacillus caldus]MBU2820153.1 hypothetical protein [Acidithiobacillus caldus]